MVAGLAEDASPIDPRFAPGAVLDRYRLISPLGTGGMSVVFEAEHLDLRKRVALKTLLPELATDPMVVARFLREGEAAARVRHPHAIEVFDARLHDGVPLLVMELLEGEPLIDLLEREVRLAPRRAVELLLPVFAAMVTAHAAGVVHRDLKPANIFLSEGPTGIIPKVLDFGIARILHDPDRTGENRRREERHRLTQPNMRLGSIWYMSPEQITDPREAGAATDQYALAVVLYLCLTGEHPFPGLTIGQVIDQVLETSPMSLRARVPSIPEELESAVLRALSREPTQRFDDVAAFGRALLPFAGPSVRAQWATAFGAPAPALPSLPVVPLGISPSLPSPLRADTPRAWAAPPLHSPTEAGPPPPQAVTEPPPPPPPSPPEVVEAKPALPTTEVTVASPRPRTAVHPLIALGVIATGLLLGTAIALPRRTPPPPPFTPMALAPAPRPARVGPVAQATLPVVRARPVVVVPAPPAVVDAGAVSAPAAAAPEAATPPRPRSSIGSRPMRAEAPRRPPPAPVAPTPARRPGQLRRSPSGGILLE